MADPVPRQPSRRERSPAGGPPTEAAPAATGWGQPANAEHLATPGSPPRHPISRPGKCQVRRRPEPAVLPGGAVGAPPTGHPAVPAGPAQPGGAPSGTAALGAGPPGRRNARRPLRAS